MYVIVHAAFGISHHLEIRAESLRFQKLAGCHPRQQGRLRGRKIRVAGLQGHDKSVGLYGIFDHDSNTSN